MGISAGRVDSSDRNQRQADMPHSLEQAMECCLVGDTAMNKDGAVALLERVTSGSTVRREVWPVGRGHQPELTLLPRPAHGEVQGHPTLSTSAACAFNVVA